jgi:hypothetical protein
MRKFWKDEMKEVKLDSLDFDDVENFKKTIEHVVCINRLEIEQSKISTEDFISEIKERLRHRGQSLLKEACALRRVENEQ